MDDKKHLLDALHVNPVLLTNAVHRIEKPHASGAGNAKEITYRVPFESEMSKSVAILNFSVTLYKP